MNTGTQQAQTRIVLPTMNPAQVADEIGDFIVAHVLNLNATGCVIGLSGGVDSTTVAALCKRAFDKYNATHENKLELVGYILPSKTNASADAEDGNKVAERLKIRHANFSIEGIIQAFSFTNNEALDSKYHRGNLSSRVRAVVLNTKGATENKLVIGTGNRDEDYGIGYYTLFGDGAVHLSPIGCLSKRLVREMASFLGFDDLAHREPTAGLEPGQTDFKDLCYKYDVVELVAEGTDQGLTVDEITCEIAGLIMGQLDQYRRMYGEPYLATPTAVVQDVLRRKEIARSKASLISPPVPKVTLDYDFTGKVTKDTKILRG